MAVIAVTRLRLRDHAYLDEFFASAVALLEQANNSAGVLGADVLAEENDAFWTTTAWQDRDSMVAYVSTDPHLTTMEHLDEWCDEATFVDWEQSSPDLPDWQTAFGRLVADGQPASLTHPSKAHETRAFPAPVESE
jgi:heme-degrading monooxygenase HmoA